MSHSEYCEKTPINLHFPRQYSVAMKKNYLGICSLKYDLWRSGLMQNKHHSVLRCGLNLLHEIQVRVIKS